MNRIVGMISSVRILLLFLILVTSCTSDDPDGAIRASGIIETEDVVVGPKVAGTVAALYAREGSRVRAGDTLLRIDDTDLLIQVDVQTAALEAAEAQYRLIARGARVEDIDQAEQGARQAKLILEGAKDDVRRLEETIESGGVSEKTLADARNRAAIAERSYRGAAAIVRRLRNGANREELQGARARVDGAEAAVRAARRRVGDCFVTAPMDGIITRRGFDVGELIPAGGNAFTITATEKVKLKIYVAENQLGRVNLGAKAAISIDTYTDRSFSGRVVYISPSAEFTPKNVQTRDDRTKLVFEVWIEVNNPGGELKSGLAAEAVLQGEGRDTLSTRHFPPPP